MPKHCIFAKFVPVEGYVQSAQRKKLLIAPFVEPLKMLLWESLTGKIYQYFGTIYLSITFFATLLLVGG